MYFYRTIIIRNRVSLESILSETYIVGIVFTKKICLEIESSENIFMESYFFRKHILTEKYFARTLVLLTNNIQFQRDELKYSFISKVHLECYSKNNNNMGFFENSIFFNCINPNSVVLLKIN